MNFLLSKFEFDIIFWRLIYGCKLILKQDCIYLEFLGEAYVAALLSLGLGNQMRTTFSMQRSH